jgi:hypothetical protein
MSKRALSASSTNVVAPRECSIAVLRAWPSPRLTGWRRSRSGTPPLARDQRTTSSLDPSADPSSTTTTSSDGSVCIAQESSASATTERSSCIGTITVTVGCAPR